MADEFQDERIFGTFDAFTQLKTLQDKLLNARYNINEGMSDEEHSERSVTFQKFTSMVCFVVLALLY